MVRTIIDRVAEWKYFDNGTNPDLVNPNGWTNIGFNDLLWKSGSAPLGYGDGDERSLVDFGPDPNNKNITTYFRKSFNIADLTAFTGFDINLQYDDGAVVYVNGVEAFRTPNMPLGAIDNNTLPLSATPNERAFFEFSVPATLFQPGENVIAVEVHQENPTSSDLSFNLELIGKNTETLVTQGDTWNFLDNGSDQSATTWNFDPNFNLAGWGTGAAELGYGDGDEATLVGFGPDPNNKFITTYFRKTFNVLDPTIFSSLEVSLKRDDGAIVYLNGTEIFRSNMPDGPINSLTLAPSSGNENDFFSAVVDSNLLVAGTNVIAVEVHQHDAPSSDVSFDLELVGSKDTLSQFKVQHTPYLQPGNMPLDGFGLPGSNTDRIDVMWQTVPQAFRALDTFTVQYRTAAVGTTPAGPWITVANPNITTLDTGVENRVVYRAEITGLNYNANYDYQVIHDSNIQTTPVATYEGQFRTRKPITDTSSTTFVTYGDSAVFSNISTFRVVQDEINKINPDFVILLGDNVYNDGTHVEWGGRLNPEINPEATQWNRNKVDYFAIGNHEAHTADGKPSEDNISVPILQPGVTIPTNITPPPNNPADPDFQYYRPEHNYSFDYGNIHFITFDSNSLNNPTALNTLLTWVESDIAAVNARPNPPEWILMHPHHPIAGVPDKPQAPGDNYYNQIVSRLGDKIDLYMVGHSHTVSWTKPLVGESQGRAIYLNDNDRRYYSRAGLTQMVFGAGGKDRSGDYSQFPFVTAGYTRDYKPDPATKPGFPDSFLDYSFARVTTFEATATEPARLVVDYIGADNNKPESQRGVVLDSFTVTKDPADSPPLTDFFAPEIALVSPADNVGNDFNPAENQLLLNEAPTSIALQLTDIGVSSVNPAIAEGIDPNTVSANTINLTKDGIALTSGVDYTFNYDPTTGQITLTPLNNTTFTDGIYQLSVNGGIALITDLSGNLLPATNYSIEVDSTLQFEAFQQGVDGYLGTVDTFLQGGKGGANTNNATSPELNVDNNDGGLPVHSLLRFENIFGTAPGQVALNANIRSAVLELNVTGEGNPLEFHRMLQPWSDTDTWNTTGNGIQPDEQESVAVADVITGEVNFEGQLSVDVTASLQAWQQNPALNYGWAILPTGTNGVDLSSAEGITPPRLVVEISSSNSFNLTPWVAPDNRLTNSPLDLEVFNGRLYQSVRSAIDNSINIRSSGDGTNWTQWNRDLAGGSTIATPTMEVFNGQLYQSVCGSDKQVYIRSSADGTNWSLWSNIEGVNTSDKTDLEVFNGRLYLTVTGEDNVIYTQSSADGINWTPPVNTSNGGYTFTSSNSEVFNNLLVQSVTGTDGIVYNRFTADGQNWSPWTGNGQLQTNAAPDLEVYNNALSQWIPGIDGQIYLSSSLDGVNWSDWAVTSGSGFPVQVSGGLVSEVFNGNLFQSVQGAENLIYNRFDSPVAPTL